MVQLKYFGDSRDYFKYDLITHVLQNTGQKHYVFVPMLTSHRVDAQGRKAPKYMEGKSASLLAFIRECDSKNLHHWETWLGPYVQRYLTVRPVGKMFFRDSGRAAYWRLFSALIETSDALVFVDPDTGLETGTCAYLKKMGREKYLLNSEVENLYKRLDRSSLLMIYQHLPNNKKIHQSSVDNKIAQIRLATAGTMACAYREDDLAFLFMAKATARFAALRDCLQAYHEGSQHRYKSLHLP